jgi:hypothetical protein
MEKVNDILWTSITLLFQLVLVGVLAGLLLGDAAGPVIGSVLVNTKSLLAALNPAAAAVVFVLYLIWRQFRGKEA